LLDTDAFGLADEYEFPGSNGRIGEIYDGPPRSEPNIATSIERAKGKWGHLMSQDEEIPVSEILIAISLVQ